MYDEPNSSLPKIVDRTRDGAPTGPNGRPGLKSLITNSPRASGAAKTALIQLIDGQIGTRRAEIDELMRIRSIVLRDG